MGMEGTESQGIPVMLDVTGWRVLIVGGGAVAARRAAALVGAGAGVTVVAPAFDDRLTALPIDRIAAVFDPAAHDVADYRLVIVATDDPAANALVAAELAKLPNPPLCNRADDGDAGEVSFMSTHRDGPLALAVYSGGASASAAAKIRDELARQIDPAWPGVLALARETRQAMREQVGEPVKRTALLRRLTDADALAAYRDGGAEALRSHYRDIMRGSA